MKKTLLLMLVIGSLVSCNKNDATPAVSAGDFKLGTVWVYKYTDYDATGAVVSTANVTLTITAQTTISGESWWVATGAGSPSYIRKTATGYYTIKNSVSQLQFKVPAVFNDTWRVTYTSAAGDYSDFKVLGLNQNVTVPMGTIACYYAEGYDSNSLEDKVWYNDANMMVKQLEFDQVGIGTPFVDFSLELVSFTL